MTTTEFTERQAEILQSAVNILVREGYAELGMRSLARASGLKLGTLQYHFPTREKLLEALVQYVESEYWSAWETWSGEISQVGVEELVRFLIEDPPSSVLHSKRLWPQLWAMGQVEPIVQQLVDDIYAQYLRTLGAALKRAGSDAPRAEAIALMSLVEGSMLFVASDRRWARHGTSVYDLVQKIVRDKYG